MVFSLFDITTEMTAIIQHSPEDGEISPQLDQWFTQLGEMEAAKLDEYYKAIEVLQGQVRMAEEQVNLYSRKIKEKLGKIVSMKERLKNHFEATGRTIITTAEGRDIRLQKNGGMQKLEIDNVADLPLSMTRTVSETVANTALIRAAIEKGEEVPGAKLLPRGTSIRFS